MTPEPSCTIEHLRGPLSAEDDQALFGWGDDVWGVKANGVAEVRFVAPEDPWRLIARLHGQAIAHIMGGRAKAEVNGRLLRLGAIGGVMTVPAARGRGLAGCLLEKCAEIFRQDPSLDVAALFCHDSRLSLYHKLGWIEPTAAFRVQQGGTLVNLPRSIHLLWRPLRLQEWPVGAISIPTEPW